MISQEQTQSGDEEFLLVFVTYLPRAIRHIFYPSYAQAAQACSLCIDLCVQESF